VVLSSLTGAHRSGSDPKLRSIVLSESPVHRPEVDNRYCSPVLNFKMEDWHLRLIWMK
jgi:hypothetical protein